MMFKNNSFFFLLFVFIILSGCSPSVSDITEESETRQPVDSNGTSPSEPGMSDPLPLEPGPPSKSDAKGTAPDAEKDASNSRLLIDADWVRDDTLILTEQKENESLLTLLQLSTGQREIIFQTEHRIQSIDTNADGSYIVVYLDLPFNEQAPLFIIDNQGQIVYENIEIAPNKWAVVEWSPIKKELALLQIISTNSRQVFLLNVLTGEQQLLPLEANHVQWDRNQGIVFEKPPVHQETMIPRRDMNYFNLVTETSESLDSDTDFFKTFSDGTLVSVIADYNESPQVTFYTHHLEQNGEKSIITTVPGLYTESEWKWIPPFDYDPETKKFYYMKVNSPSQFLLNNDNQYMLHAITIDGEEDQPLMEVKNPQQFKLSPDGKQALLFSHPNYANPFQPGSEIYLLELTDESMVHLDQFMNE